MVLLSDKDVNAILGGRNPLEVDFTSSCADDDGVVVPIPTWAVILELKTKSAKRKKVILRIVETSFTIFKNTKLTLVWVISIQLAFVKIKVLTAYV
jgi:hypothetical protein